MPNCPVKSCSIDFPVMPRLRWLLFYVNFLSAQVIASALRSAHTSPLLLSRTDGYLCTI